MADDTAADTSERTDAKLTGADLARRAVEEARKSGSFVRASLGAESLIPAEEKPVVAVGEPAPPEKAQPVKIINAALPSADTADTRPADAAPVEPTKKSSGKKIQTAALGAGTKSVRSFRHRIKSAIDAFARTAAVMQGLDGELRRRPFRHHQSPRRSPGQLYGSRRQRGLGEARSGGLHRGLCQGRQVGRRILQPIAGARQGLRTLPGWLSAAHFEGPPHVANIRPSSRALAQRRYLPQPSL